MLEELKTKVWQANIDLVKSGLVLFTWGNASAIDRKSGLVVIKPSGVGYDVMKPEDMVVVDLEGNIVEGSLTLRRILFSIRRFRISEESSTLIPRTPPPGPKWVGIFLTSGRLMPIISMMTSLAPAT